VPKYRDQVKPPDGRATRASATTQDPQAPGVAALPSPPMKGGPARFEIPYQPSEGTARRVIIPVTFNGSVTSPMALDTGSPGMVISFELAERLGVFSRGKGALVTQAAGIGGAVPAILTIIDSIAVGGAQSSFVPTTVTFPVSTLRP
jgi:hypothetical protein